MIATIRFKYKGVGDHSFFICLKHLTLRLTYGNLYCNMEVSSRGGDQMEKLYTPQEVADYLGYSLKTIQNYIAGGKIKSVKVLGVNRVKESDIKELIKTKN